MNQAMPKITPVLMPLRLDQVTFTIAGKVLIDSITTTFSSGAPSLVLGPNGAGKSLLLRLCHGLLAPTGGSVSWQSRSAVKERQAMVFQRPVLLRRSVEANILYALRVRGVGRSEAQQRVVAMLQRSGLSRLADRQAHVLSGGEQQRLSVARAWALQPEVLFLDEPTANLDPAGVRAVEDMIRGVVKEGAKVIMTTHDLGQARRLAGEVLFLHHGKLLEQTSADRFFSHPESEPAKAFIEGRLLW